MRRFIKTLLIICIMAAGLTASAARRTPGEKVGVSFQSLIHDFGTIKASATPVEHEFTFTVTGNTPVAILYATPSCGCTASDFPRKPTGVGESGVITISFNPKGQKGEIDKDVRVRFKNGAGKSEQLTLRITGVVVPD